LLQQQEPADHGDASTSVVADLAVLATGVPLFRHYAATTVPFVAEERIRSPVDASVTTAPGFFQSRQT